jgi:hypothetical protein
MMGGISMMAMSLLNVDCINSICEANARINAVQMQWIVATYAYWNLNHDHKSLEAAGHLCLFLPKFHCEFNLIEYFWGMVKKYLSNNCDYTFDTLKENMLKALASIPLHNICRWEHQMYQWMEAYRSGLGPKMLSFRSRCSVQQSTSHTDTFWTLLQVLLTEILKPLVLARQIGPAQNFFLTQFSL